MTQVVRSVGMAYPAVFSGVARAHFRKLRGFANRATQ